MNANPHAHSPTQWRGLSKANDYSNASCLKRCWNSRVALTLAHHVCQLFKTICIIVVIGVNPTGFYHAIRSFISELFWADFTQYKGG